MHEYILGIYIRIWEQGFEKGKDRGKMSKRH